MVPAPILACLAEIDKKLGISGRAKWGTNNPVAEKFFREVNTDQARAEIERMRSNPGELQSMATENADELNEFFQRNGFDIHVDPLKPGEFGVGSIFRLLLKWVVDGEKSFVFTEEMVKYTAVKMAGKNLDFLNLPGNETPLVRVPTRSGDNVLFFMPDGHSGVGCSDDVDMIKMATDVIQISRQNNHIREEVATFTFPMIDLEFEHNISYFEGSTTCNGLGLPYEMSRAVQITKLLMNEFGVKLQSAVGMVMRSLSQPIHFFINKGFYMIIERPGMEKPLMVGFFDTDAWGEPENFF